jgi:cob(I)alamin adenosyltransferase
MKIYTQTGDRGKTSMLSGERVAKDHVRIDAYGEIDELNAGIGILIAFLEPGADRPAADQVDQVKDQLLGIQSDLFVTGAWLAATPDSEARKRLAPLTETHTQAIESFIDAMQAQLPELKSFILPGGHVAAAWAHLVRTVCRRVERAVVHLDRTQDQQESGRDDLKPVVAYINRLSDYFFVLARYLNQKAEVADLIWRS